MIVDTLPAQLSPLNYVEGVVGVGILVFVWNVVYNLYFHPLAGIPGPKLAAITQLYYVKYLLSGRLPFQNLKLHQKYGPVVRIAPNELSFNNAEGWKDIYGTRPGKPEMPKDPLFYSTTSSGPVGLFGSTRERHGPLRRLVSHGFSERALRTQEDLIQKYGDILFQKLRKHAENGEMVDLVKWYNFFTFDVIGDLAFGEPFGCLDDGVYHPWVAAIFSSVKMSSWLRTAGYYPTFTKLLQRFIIPPSLKERRARHNALTLAKVRARQERKSDRADFLSGFLVDGADASDAEMVSTARLLVVAGSETTATLLSGITYLLLKNPGVLQKLTEEVRNSFEDETEINLTGANKLRYMLACLDEALRMYPPVPGSLPRDVPPGGDKIGDQFVPEKTVVAVTQYATYHDPVNFYLPDEYIPERWLDDKRFVNDNKAAFQPFSTGPRNCVGRNLAYLEMRIVLARLLWNFDLVRLSPESEDWANQNVYLLWEKPPLMVELKSVTR